MPVKKLCLHIALRAYSMTKSVSMGLQFQTINNCTTEMELTDKICNMNNISKVLIAHLFDICELNFYICTRVIKHTH